MTVDGPERQFVRGRLNPGLFSRSFEIQTRWHVITGAACTGKTTLIDLLRERGYPTVAETAREHFECELAVGRGLEDIRADGELLQRCILDRQLRAERNIRPEEVAFLDRGVPDSLSFYRVHGLDPNQILPDCLYHQYASVFILDRLPLKRANTLGPEDEEASRFLDEWLERDYGALGYGVVRVPPLSPQRRADFVLDWLSSQDLIEAK